MHARSRPTHTNLLAPPLPPPLPQVRVVVTDAARHFVPLAEGYDAAWWARCHALSPPVPPPLTNEDEWRSYASVHRDEVLHIEVTAAGAWLCAPARCGTASPEILSDVTAYDFRGAATHSPRHLDTLHITTTHPRSCASGRTCW
jgi:hypothetical protein